MNKCIVSLAALCSLSQTVLAQDLPNLYVVADALAESTNATNDPNDNKIRLREIEIGVSGDIHDALTGTLILAVEQEYATEDELETELEVEEANLSYRGFDDRLSVTGGRKLMAFGQLNPVHRHHWTFVDMPLAMKNIFGDHPWLDDGVELSVQHVIGERSLLQFSAGAWNGNALGHGHEDEHEDEDLEHEDEDLEHEEEEGDHHDEEFLLDWNGHVFTGRLAGLFPLHSDVQARIGYSIAGDEGGTLLHGADVLLNYTHPDSGQRLTWHSEWIHHDGEEPLENTHGLFSSLAYAPNSTWELGGRYDWAESLNHPGEDQYGGAGFITYSVNHSTYIRGQATYLSDVGEGEETRFTLQWVWGLGNHGSAKGAAHGPSEQHGHQHGPDCGH